ncbi:MAG: DUF2085 domain-containing protein [Actinobacteria bacterium]|nr:DUF2085 domain-containing protein [Actinomycetota bacterium]
MESWLTKFINIIGSSVCHQLPERSLGDKTLIMPVCSRCEGIYVGFFIAAIIIFLLFKKKENELPPLYVLITMIAFVISTIVEGALGFFSIAHTNNVSRFVTGYLAGSAVMVIVFPIFNYQYYKDSITVRIFLKPWQFITFLSINIAFIAIILLDLKFLNYFFFYFSSISVLFTFYFINLILLLLIPAFSQKALFLFSRYLVLPTIFSLMLTALEIYLSYRFHQFLLKLN